MGCHTFFYKKKEVSFDKAKENAIIKIKDNILLLERWINNPLDDEYIELIYIYPEYTIDKLQEELLMWNDKLQHIENGTIEEQFDYVMKTHEDECSDVCFWSKEHGFYISNDNLPHDIFRLGGYPEDELFSLEETLDFIERNKDKITYHNKDWKEQLEDFFRKNPDGAIDFG